MSKSHHFPGGFEIQLSGLFCVCVILKGSHEQHGNMKTDALQIHKWLILFAGTLIEGCGRILDFY
jgi:hypothetical protein